MRGFNTRGSPILIVLTAAATRAVQLRRLWDINFIYSLFFATFIYIILSLSLFSLFRQRAVRLQ